MSKTFDVQIKEKKVDLFKTKAELKPADVHGQVGSESVRAGKISPAMHLKRMLRMLLAVQLLRVVITSNACGGMEG